MNILDVATYLNEGIDSFVQDPADSDYQRGYEAALNEARNFVINGIVAEGTVDARPA